MVILIGGPGCTGKTLMAHQLMQLHHINYISIDHIKMGLSRGSKYCDFTPEDNSHELGEKIWPVIKGIIMTTIENNQDIIIEGSYLLPHLIVDFDTKYLDKILSIFICFSGDYIENHFTSGILEHRDAIEKRQYPHDLSIPETIAEHHELIQQCKHYGLFATKILNDYESEMIKAYDYIAQRLPS